VKKNTIPKEEIKSITEHLNRVVKSAKLSLREVKNSATDIYNNNGSVVESSVFTNTKLRPPKCVAIDIGDITQQPSLK